MADKKVNFIHLCEHFIISSKGIMSLIDIFDKLYVKDLPTVYPKMILVSGFDVKPDDANVVTISVEDPDGKEIFKQEGPISPAKSGKMNFSADLSSLIKFEKEGEYIFKISVNNDYSAETRIRIKKVEQEG